LPIFQFGTRHFAAQCRLRESPPCRATSSHEKSGKFRWKFQSYFADVDSPLKEGSSTVASREPHRTLSQVAHG
jgi:hypothetical protein